MVKYVTTERATRYRELHRGWFDSRKSWISSLCWLETIAKSWWKLFEGTQEHGRSSILHASGATGLQGKET